MIKKIKYFLLILIPFLFIGCDFQFSEDFYVNLEQNVPDSQVSLQDFVNNQKVNASKEIRYNYLSSSKNKLYQLKVFVDQTEIFLTTTETNGQFYLYIDDLSDGNHTLKLEYIVSSGSGSLADLNNGEAYIRTDEYVFRIDKSLAEPFSIKNVEIRDGTIYVSWNQVQDTNFNEAYLIVKNEEGYVVNEQLITEADINNFQFNDTETIVYNPSFAIKVKNAFQEKTSPFVALLTDKMTFDLVPEDLEHFKLNYSAHPLYGNFDALYFEYYAPNSGNREYSINPKGGELIANGSFFGHEMFTKLRFNKNGVEVGNYFEDLFIGKKLELENFEEIFYSKNLNKYFVLDLDINRNIIIYQLNGDDFNIEKSVNILTVNHVFDFLDLQNVVASNDLVLNFKGKSIVFDMATFTTKEMLLSTDYNSQKTSTKMYLRNNFIVLEDDWPSGEVIIYEKSTKIEKFRIRKTTDFFSSPNLKYFYANKDLYKNNNGIFTFLTAIKDEDNVSNPVEYSAFSSDEKHYSFSWNQNTNILNTDNLDVNKIHGPVKVSDLIFTPENNVLTTSNHFSAGDMVELYNVNSNKVKFIRVVGSYYTKFRYLNGYLFSMDGKYVKTDLYEL